MALRRPFIFLYTGDEFLRRKKIESCLADLLSASDRASNLFRLYPDDFNLSLLISQAKTGLLTGGPQVFWVTQTDRIKSDDWSLLEAYCAEPSADSFYIFEAEELPGTHPVVKLARQYGTYQYLEARTGEGPLEPFREKMKRAGKQLTSPAWVLLEERFGGSLVLMDASLDQLILYANGNVIDEDAVEKLSGEFFRYDVFDLTDALLEKQTDRAIKIFNFFCDLTGDITSTVGLLHWQIKRFWQAKRILSRGGSKEEVGRTLRIPPSRLFKFLAQVQKFDSAMIERLIKQLWEVDWQSKTGACNEKIAVETFLASAG